MSQVNPYGSIGKRSFGTALMRLLLTEYGLQGGRRIAMLLVEDVEKLIQEFYPDVGQTASGTLVWTCTADEGKKATAGKPTEEYKTVTVKLPFVTQEEVNSHADGKTDTRQREKRQMVRLLKAADEQGGLLTLAELSLLLNRSYQQVSRYVQEWKEETGDLLPLKGYRMDQGSSPSHKGEIVRLFEQGKHPPDIAYETRHNLMSVERYLKDYERVKMLLKDKKSAEEISALIGRGKHVVLEYIQITRKFHPELFQDAS